MSKIQFGLAGLGVLILIGFLTVTVGSGVVETETRTISNIREVRLNGQGQIIVKQGDRESLTIEAEDNVLPLIDTTISGETLTIDFDTGWFRTVWPREEIKYYLTLSEPREFTISGSGSLEANDISVESFRVRINGSGKGFIDNLKTDRLTTEVNGSGKFSIRGEARKQTIKISGSGDYEARNLTSDVATVKISGSGKTELNVRNELDVQISGSGKVLYRRNPKISQQISGSGKIRSLD